MLFFIYARKSVFTGKGESIDNQIDMSKQYILTKHPDATEDNIKIFVDEGFSAKNTDRPEFQHMLNEIRRQKPDFVVCYRLDRISRNVSDFSSLIEDLNEKSISFVCIKEEFDTSKPMGKAMMYIASVFAQLERETIAERVRDNMMLLARTGRWLGGTTPTGFTSERTREIIIDGKLKSSCKLKDCPEELYAVDLMFDKFLETGSISAVSKFLLQQGIRSRTGKVYSLLGIKEILQNPVYCIADKDARNYFIEHDADVCFEASDCDGSCGLLSYNKRDYKKKNAPRQPVNKWIVAIGKHRGRIPGCNWVTVQQALEQNIPTGKRPANVHNGSSILSGLIYCQSCGERMFAKQRSGKNANPELYDYICNTKLRGGTQLCHCQNINGRQADGMVCNYLIQFVQESPQIFQLLDRLESDIMKNQGQDPFASLESQIKKRNEEMDNLVASLSQVSANPILLEKVNARAEVLGTELAKLKEEYARLQKEEDAPAGRKRNVDLLAKALCGIKNIFETMSVYDKRSFVRLLVEKIVWTGRDFHIYMYGE